MQPFYIVMLNNAPVEHGGQYMNFIVAESIALSLRNSEPDSSKIAIIRVGSGVAIFVKEYV